MLQGVREFAATVRVVLLWILAPLLVLGALIYEVFRLHGEIKGKEARDEAESKVRDAKETAAKAVKESNDAEEEYRRVRARTLADESDRDGGGDLPPAS